MFRQFRRLGRLQRRVIRVDRLSHSSILHFITSYLIQNRSCYGWSHLTRCDRAAQSGKKRLSKLPDSPFLLNIAK